MTDSKYFTTTKKGEIFELKSELNNDKKEKKKEAVKKVIASMTVGKDVSALFPDVVNCMQTDNLELKKLVYLYLMNYAKSQPDMAIMAVNTFVKDCEDPNPLIRALAVRTMGCIRVDKITEYLCEPLRKCLKDEDPYVRKTAAVCVAKLYDISSGLVEDQGFLEQLKELLSDSNPMVVANAVAALSEINESSPTGQPLVELNHATINKLLTALNECTEWGQVFILDSLSNYNPKDEREAQSICERITPRLAHANAAVVSQPLSEYAERIDNADELLDSFLEGFADENAQVQLQLLTAVVKLFLKRPAHTQALVQHVLSLATQDSDNPDLRDRGFIYWRLLSTDPAAAKEVVLADKPLISEETDLLEPTLLDELICHISSLASVYHKPPTAFVEGRSAGIRKTLPARQGSAENTNAQEATVIPNQESLIGDLLSMDIGSTVAQPQPAAPPTSNVDLLGGGLDVLLGGGPSDLGVAPSTTGLLGDIFGLSSAPTMYTPPKTCWLPADKGKGLEIMGTFSRRAGQITMDLSCTNKAMQAMSGFAIQFNKNSFGVAPAAPMNMGTLQPGQTLEYNLPLNTNGPVQRMEPLTTLQVAIKNNVDVFYYACQIPIQVLFIEDGTLDKRVFLTTWRDIPSANEVQYTLNDLKGNSDAISAKMTHNNIFTIAKRNVEGQDMLYQSLKLTNNIWVLLELKLQPGVNHATLSLKSRSVEVAPFVFQAYDAIIKNT
ncbi:AP-2 complex subunit beta-like Protein [Tribolium castaneum]|uniref:AP-2 complex subunit beta-like Protein n=1 Tax=Tribolium castaneum TaxID=7070 RepID=D2A641_TRICA|nr:AP-2 complex subunit beta-like Protein [Tribolium castaneum]